MPERARLPIDAVLDELAGHLRRERNLVLIAPPGAGKTTRVPQALVDARLVADGTSVVVLEPRRLAARLAAKRIAAERGVRLGGEVGYQVRFDDRTSKDTRIAFLTEGILTRRLQSDPTLEGVGAVLLDEFHERSIHADLALAFLREVQETVRPDLILIVMSATLDPGPVAAFLGGARTIQAEGRSYPVELEYLDAPDERPVVDAVVSGVRRVIRTDPGGGSVLAFLPGAPEIRRAEAELVRHLEGVDVRPLYGELPPEAQDRAVEPSARRKVVLATNIAESSLTIEGITTVVDAGYAKVSRHDPALGIDRLEVSRISRASADQRAGRAGRTGPGRALRLWTEKEDRLLAPAELPEIARVDLAPTALEVIRWSSRDPREFRFFEAPPPATLERALELLELFGAIDAGHRRLTALGERLSAFPLHPRLAMILVSAARRGALEDGALVAALASERDVLRRGGRPTDEVGSSDVLQRLEKLSELERARSSPAIADRLGLDLGASRAVLDVRDRLLDVARRTLPGERARRSGGDEALLRAVLAGYPDRVGRRRAPGDDKVTFVGGGGARVARESVVKEGDLLVAVDVDAGARGKRDGALIRIASQIERAWLAEDTAGVREVKVARWNRERQAVECWIEVRYRDLLIEERRQEPGDEDEIARVLEVEAAADLDRALPVSEDAARLLARLAFLARSLPESAIASGDPRRNLLPELCRGRRSFADLRAVDLASELVARLPHGAQRLLDREAPDKLEVPSGRKVPLRYEHDGPPVLAVRLQEVFGLTRTPRVAEGRVAVKMELLAPNMRPVQVTQDLESFWANTYAEVRNELRRRYPKHQWPEDPRDGDPRKRPGRRS